MPTAIITPDQDTIVSEIDISAPPERVFKALSDAAELKRWFRNPECPTKFWMMDARVDGHYGYATEKGRSPSMASANSNATARSSNSILRASSSIPGSPTGTTTNRSQRTVCAGN